MTFTSSFNHQRGESQGISHTYRTYTGIIIFLIDCLRFNTCRVHMSAHRRASLFKQTSLLPRQSWHRSQWTNGHYAWDPIVQGRDPTSIIVPSFHWPAVPASSIMYSLTLSHQEAAAEHINTARQKTRCGAIWWLTTWTTALFFSISPFTKNINIHSWRERPYKI